MNDARRKFLQTAGLSAAYAAVSSGAFTEEGDMGSKPATGNRCPEKPKAIISGESQTEGMAKFAHRLTYEDLAPERRERLKVSILDSLACAINALGASPTAACLAQAKEFGGPNGRCTLIGGGKANVLYAALSNTALVRYIDFMDSYLAGPELCHPSDNTGAVLAACEHTGRSGKEFLTALAIAYQVQTVLTSSAPFMERGFDIRRRSSTR
jgi:2-methylcitrate dehydratase